MMNRNTVKTDLDKDFSNQEQVFYDRQMPLKSLYDNPEGWLFLDANSVGPVPVSARAMAEKMVHDWTTIRCTGWESEDWIAKPNILGDQISPLIGANQGEVIVCDTTTTNLYKAMGHALAINSNRTKVLTHYDNFPTDHHVLQGLAQNIHHPLEIIYVETQAQAIAAMSTEVAFCTFSHVDYKHSLRWDMEEVNQAAIKQGVLTIWDVSHSAGVLPIDVKKSRADYVVGCGYKYLSLGPGAPAFLYVNPALITKASSPICGWMGHKNLSEFSNHFIPSETINKFATSTQAVAANQMASCAAQIFAHCDVNKIWQHHQTLSEYLVRGLLALADLGVTLLSPLDYRQQGGHVSFSTEQSLLTFNALKDAKIIGSFRQPHFIRFGISPMTLSINDLTTVLNRLKNILIQQKAA